MTSSTIGNIPAPRKRRLRRVEVSEVRRLSPRMVSVSFTGEFDDFEIASPTGHVKIVVPEPGRHDVVLPDDGGRPVMRTYTPRRFDPVHDSLEVQFVLHGEGPAATWAQHARTGDQLALAGPGGRMPLELTSGHWIVGGDESALPAIGTLIEALPAESEVEIYVETEGDQETVLDVDVPVTWLRRSQGVDPGSALHAAIGKVAVTPDSKCWLACESTAVRRTRHMLLESTSMRPDRLVTRGYWRAGKADHPDHDYGED